MKKSIPTFSNSDAGLEIELARRRAIHHVHDAARILTDVMHYVEPAYRQSYTAIVGSLSDLELRIHSGVIKLNIFAIRMAQRRKSERECFYGWADLVLQL